MTKEKITIRIDTELLKQINQLSSQTGKTKTSIISQAIEKMNRDNAQDHQRIELLSKENEQMHMLLSATQAVIKEKDHVIESKNELISELRRKKRGFFSRLFGL